MSRDIITEVKTHLRPGFTYKFGLIGPDGKWVFEITGASLYELGYMAGINPMADAVWDGADAVEDESPKLPNYRWMDIYGHSRLLVPGDIVSAKIQLKNGEMLNVGIQRVIVRHILPFMPVYGNDEYTPEKDGCDPGDTVFIYVNGKKCVQTAIYKDRDFLLIDNLKLEKN